MESFIKQNFTEPIRRSDNSPDASGLMDCSFACIPFFKGTLPGNVAYSAVLFGAFSGMERRVPSLRQNFYGKV
jgi:hypothetical protein